MTTLENNARKLLAELGDAIDQLSKENQRLRAIVDGGEHLAMPQSAQAKQALRSLFKRNTSSRAHTRRVIECTARIEQAHGDGINDLAAAWSERGVIASASVDGSARVWRFRDVQGGHLNYTGHAHGSSVNSVAWHPTDSALLLTAGGDGSAHIVCIPSYNSSQWSPRHAKSRNLSNPGTTFSSECSSHGLKKPLSRAVWMYNGKVVVTSDLAGVVSVWNVSRPECPFSELKGHSQAVTHIDVSGDVVVSASEDSNAHLWDLRYSVDPVHVFSSHSARINSTVISAPGSSIQMIATAGEDRLVKLWDYRSLTKPIVEISCASAANKYVWIFTLKLISFVE